MDSEVLGAGGASEDVSGAPPVDNQDLFEWAFNHASVPRSITWPTGEAQFNDAFCEMLGYTRDELGQGPRGLASPIPMMSS